MMLIPRQYDADLFAMAETHAREGADGSISAAVRCALLHGLDPEEQRRALSGCVVAYSPESFAGLSERDGFTEVRSGHPRAWIVYLPDRWDATGAASRRIDDQEFRLLQKRALAYMTLPACNDPSGCARTYPLVVPHDLERDIRALATEWSVSPAAALSAVLELGLAGFRKWAAHAHLA